MEEQTKIIGATNLGTGQTRRMSLEAAPTNAEAFVSSNNDKSSQKKSRSRSLQEGATWITNLPVLTDNNHEQDVQLEEASLRGEIHRLLKRALETHQLDPSKVVVPSDEPCCMPGTRQYLEDSMHAFTTVSLEGSKISSYSNNLHGDSRRFPGWKRRPKDIPVWISPSHRRRPHLATISSTPKDTEQ